MKNYPVKGIVREGILAYTYFRTHDSVAVIYSDDSSQTVREVLNPRENVYVLS